MNSISVLDSSPQEVTIAADRVIVRMSDGSEVSAAFNKYERLRDATRAQLQNWEWTGSRSGIYWPDVDEDLSVHGMIREHIERKDSLGPIPFLIADLMRITEALNRLAPHRKFTPDGHLVGSIGEIVAEYVYDLKLETCSNPGFDARTKDDKTVEIKLTGEHGKRFGLYWSNERAMSPPDFLIALKLQKTGFVEIYNGEFPTDLLKGRKDQKNGQLSLTVKALQERSKSILPQVRPLTDFNRRFDFELDSAA